VGSEVRRDMKQHLNDRKSTLRTSAYGETYGLTYLARSPEGGIEDEMTFGRWVRADTRDSS
jgi:hypothetical protein